MKHTQNRLVFSNYKDPFADMIIRPHKSPRLHAVLIDSRNCLKISKSAGSIRDRIVLPPLLPSKNKGDTAKFDRIKLQTPDFNINQKKNYVREPQKEKVKPPEDLSFGDLDEKVEGLNFIMKKYHF